MKYSNTFAISCDWLQIHVKSFPDFLEHENPFYTFKRTGQSKVWRNIYEVRNTVLDIVVAHYCTDAQECIMAKDHGVLKFENNQLYVHDNLKEFVKLFLARLNFKFIGITRFDIAFDFQKFYKEYDPRYFVANYVNHKILKLNGNNKSFGLMGKQMMKEHNFQTLNFGAKHSNINIKMYNKTQELKEQKKPWIEALHKDTFADNKSDVWRLEFSLFSMTTFFKKEGKTGEGYDFTFLQKQDFHSLDCLDLVSMYGIFIGLFKKHFRFKHYSKTQKRITRMREVELWHFELDALQLKMVKRNPLVRQSGRSDKIALRWLQKELHSLGVADENFQTAACEIFGKVISSTALEDWAKTQGIEFAGHENYISNVYEYKKLLGNQDKLDVNFSKAVLDGKFEEYNEYLFINRK